MPATRRLSVGTAIAVREGTQRMTDLALFADELRKGFDSLGSRFATASADHDNIIRLLAGQENAAADLRDLRRDMEARHGTNVATINQLEGRLRNQEDGAAKLSGVHLAVITGIPVVISTAGFFLTFFLLRH